MFERFLLFKICFEEKPGCKYCALPLLLTNCHVSFRVRHKQNKYPILFLTQGISEKYPELMDIRCQTTQIAISFAQSENILVSSYSRQSNCYHSIMLNFPGFI